MKFVIPVLVISSLMIGCSSAPADSTAATDNKPATTTNAVTASESNTPAATAEMANCDFCNAEMPKAELAAHDGKMACKACIAAHGH